MFIVYSMVVSRIKKLVRKKVKMHHTCIGIKINQKTHNGIEWLHVYIINENIGMIRH